MIDLDKLIAQANELAPLPASAVRLAEVVGRANCHLEEVAELIAFDQALTVKLLRVVNSAAHAAQVRATTVQEAVAHLGTARVLALVVASGAKPVLQRGAPAYGLCEGALWRHSVAAAVAAETTATLCRVEIPPEAFTAALLHDIGKLIMGRFLSPEILALLQRARQAGQLDPLEAESQLLGVNHGELGGLIAQHWKLPDRIVQGITFHHAPDHGFDVVCDLVYLANQIAKRIEADLDGRKFSPALLPSVSQRVGIALPDLEDVYLAAAARFSEVRQRYNSI